MTKINQCQPIPTQNWLFGFNLLHFVLILVSSNESKIQEKSKIQNDSEIYNETKMHPSKIQFENQSLIRVKDTIWQY